KGPNLDNANVGEVSHMCFADALLEKRITGLFATHPPLDDRIRRVDPNCDGELPKVERVGESAVEEKDPQAGRRPPFGAMPTRPGVPQVPSPVLVAGADEAVARIGKVTPAQATYAADMRAAIPKPLREAARDPFSARALVYCLLLDPSTEVRKSQLDR